MRVQARRLGLPMATGQGGTTCFAAGMPLLTPDGAKAIEDFRPGDLILSRDEDDARGPVVVGVVEDVFVRVSPILRLRVGGRDVLTTVEHPFWVTGRGWTNAGHLAPGDELVSHDDRHLAVEAVEDAGLVSTVYNLCVAGYHTYFVGCQAWGFSVWAHNSNVCATVLDPHGAPMGGPSKGKYVAYHATNDAAAENLVAKGIDSKMLGNPNEFQLAIDPKRAANFGAGAVADNGGTLKLVRFEIPEELFLDLYAKGHIKAGATTGSISLDQTAQAAINRAMGK